MISSLREVLQTAKGSRDGWELCATADAKYDRTTATVLFELDVLVQAKHWPSTRRGFRPSWLPAMKVVRRKVPLCEARGVARSVFRQWKRKVRQAVPAPAHHSAD